MSVNSIATSGLLAAQKRVNVSASNVANARSNSERDGQGNVINKAYEPRRVETTTQVGGGVSANVVIDPNPTVTIQAVSGDILAGPDGSIEIPNVDFAEEFIQQKMATYDYRANLKVLETQKELQETLIDVLA